MLQEDALTLRQLSLVVKDTLERGLPDTYWVRAEIHDLRVSGAGHCSVDFIQKDERSDQVVARMHGNIWVNRFGLIKSYFEQQTGQLFVSGIKVLVRVKVTYHEVYGLALNVQDIDPSYTLGDMQQVRQRILNQLEKEGILEMNKELEMPELPQRIAVISSPTAAGYGDFCNQLSSNSAGYYFKTELFPAIMQGREVEQSIIRALDAINDRLDEFDCVVIIRGGGAKSDLVGFDTYDLAVACCNFPLPLITGIGHERDNTVLDCISKVRVKTPTAAAEYLISCLEAQAERIRRLSDFLSKTSQVKLQEALRRLQNAQMRLPVVCLQSLKKEGSKLEDLQARLLRSTTQRLEKERHRLDMHLQHLYDIAPERILEKGYGIVMRDDRLLKSAKGVESGTIVEIRLHDGNLRAVTK